MFSINTNVTSLQAQNYLRKTQNFQSETINQVTSGLRIVNSGDDAAGLAIANSDRSNEAVLTQGVQNASNGLSQLQIADGGLSNISQLLDRARTLATESASGSFTGDRGVLNAEFQSVIGEVNRQAQAIGLNQGGQFATNLNVFVGGGATSNGTSAATNGTVSVNLSSATVDAKSLGLEGVRATGTAGTDLGSGSSTSVQAIVNNASNQASISNNTTNFSFTGPGFSDTTGNNTIKVAVNLTGVTDVNTLVTTINQAIQNAGNGGSQQATAFKNANITASVNTDSTGKQQLSFSSSSAAFQVQGDDQVATAFLGSFQPVGGSVLAATGNSAIVSATGAQATYVTPGTETVNVRIVGAGLTGSQGEFNVALTAADSTQALTVTAINAAIAGNAALAATGIEAVGTGSGATAAIAFVGKAGQSFQVQTSNDNSNTLGFGTWANSNGYAAGGGAAAAGNFDYSTITGAATPAIAGGSQHAQISINGGATIDLGVITTTAGAGNIAEVSAINALNAAFNANAATRAAGLSASDNAGAITISSSTGTNFRLNLYGGGAVNVLGFGSNAAGGAATAVGYGSVSSSYAAKETVNSAGAQQSVNSGTNTDVYQFTGLTNAGDAQTLSISAVDSTGQQHSLNVGLTAGNASTLDQVLQTINSAIASSNDSTLKQVAAFKEQGSTASTPVNGVEGIRFLSAGSAFKVSLGASPLSSTSGTNVGIADGVSGTNGGAVLSSSTYGTGSTADISNISTATAAVNQLALSVASLGNAQAAVGRGENQMNYAVNLANSQLTNLAASESGIRDADMASASANLTKAQIQLQAGIAALAQANSAPQQVLSLLKQ